MRSNLLCWWHRVILRHVQVAVMNGETEPGVRCWCGGKPWGRVPGVDEPRWFPSDGGNGK